jgi:hypothetical protein
LEEITKGINAINERLGKLTEMSLEEKNIENELIEVVERLSGQGKSLNALIEKTQLEGKSLDEFKEQTFNLVKTYHELEGRLIMLEKLVRQGKKPSRALDELWKELKGIEKQLLEESSIIKAFRIGTKKEEVVIESELRDVKEALKKMPEKTDLDSLKEKMKGLELKISEKVKGEKAEALLGEAARLHEEIEEVKKFEKETQAPLKVFPAEKKALTVKGLAEELKEAEVMGKKIDAERIAGMIEEREHELAGLIAEGIEAESKKLAKLVDFEKIYNRLVAERKEKQAMASGKAVQKPGKPVVTKTEEKDSIEAELIAQGIEAEEIGENIDVEKIWKAIKRHEVREKKLLHEKIRKAAEKAKKEVRLMPETRKAELRLMAPAKPVEEERKSFFQQLKEALFGKKE